MKKLSILILMMMAFYVPSSSLAADPATKTELRSGKASLVYIGKVTRTDGVIYLYTESGSNRVTYAEFYSPTSTYILLGIVNGATDYTIVRGQFTFADENDNIKVIVLNNATLE